jgi:spore coat polysaccharide biosynthesis protein SpsF
MTIGCIVQARMGSSRLPGKVMMDVEKDKPVLHYVISQLRYCKLIDKLIVATTTLSEDDKIVKYCKELGVDSFRGSAQNVLDRYYQCAKKFSITTIVRIPSDKPLIDPEIVDSVIDKFRLNSYDYVINFSPPTFPSGTEVEVFSFKALETAWKNAVLPSEKEHVTSYIDNHKEKFKIFNVMQPEDLSRYRWAVDRMEDLTLVRNIVSKIKKRPILMRDVLDLFKKEPHLVDINKNVNREEGNIKSLKEDEEFLKSRKV